MSLSKRSTLGSAGPDLSQAHETASEVSFQSFARVVQASRDADTASCLDVANGTAMQWAQLCFAKALTASSRTYVDPLAEEDDSDDWDQQSDAAAWTVEARTWVLIALLTAKRQSRKHAPHANADAHAHEELSYVSGPYTPPSVRALKHVRGSDELSEMGVVRSWLQEYVLPIAHPVEMRKGYWPTTKNSYKATRRTEVHIRSVAPTSKGKLSLDPDLPTRQGKTGAPHLDLQDAQYDKAAWRYLFEAVRNGRLDLCLDVCKAMNHSWKAASLRGSLLYTNQWADGEQVPAGNRNRFLWKTVCRKLGNDISIDPYERALYGVLGGDVSSVLPVSHSWEEQLWAFVYTMLESKIDTMLAQASDEEVPVGQASWGLGTGQSDEAAAAGIKLDGAIDSLASVTLRYVFERLDQTEKDGIALQARDPYRTFQRDFILHDLDSLLLSAESRLNNAPSTMSRGQYARFVRFFAHYILFVRLVDPEAEATRQENLASGLPASAAGLATNTILRAYVQLLEEAGQGDDLVALYASNLDRTNAIDSYAQYLRSLGPNLSVANRWSALQQADDHQLDLPAVARRTTQLILDEALPALGDVLAYNKDQVPLDLTVTDVETRLIGSLTWLAFSNQTWPDYIIQANRVLRLFWAGGRVNAARRLVASLSPDITGAAIGGLDFRQEDSLLLTEDQKVEHKGYLLLSNFYHKTDAFHDIWAQRTEQTTQARSTLVLWTQQVGLAVDEVYKAALQTLKDHCLEVSSPQESERLEQLKCIRQQYIPDMVFRLHSLFIDTHRVLPQSLARALQLPNLLVDENYRLYLAFLSPKGNRLIPYLRMVREAALLQLDQPTAELGDPFVAARYEDPLLDESPIDRAAQDDEDTSVIDLVPDE